VEDQRSLIETRAVVGRLPIKRPRAAFPVQAQARPHLLAAGAGGFGARYHHRNRKACRDTRRTRIRDAGSRAAVFVFVSSPVPCLDRPAERAQRAESPH
jgi:hypothetical protein